MRTRIKKWNNKKTQEIAREVLADILNAFNAIQKQRKTQNR